MNYVNLLGYIAATLSTLASLPQLYRIVSTKSAEDISLTTYSMMLAAMGCWFSYGVMMHSRPLIMANLVSAVIISSIIYFKFRYGIQKVEAE